MMLQSNLELPPIGDSSRPTVGPTLSAVASPCISDEPAYGDDHLRDAIQKSMTLPLPSGLLRFREGLRAGNPPVKSAVQDPLR